MRNPFGLAIEDTISGLVPAQRTLQMPVDAPAQPKQGRGDLLLGILADALQGAAGQPGMYAQLQGQRRKQEQEEAQWGLRRRGELEDYEKKQQIEQRYRPPDVSPMERDASAWLRMGLEQQAAYRAAQAAKPQFIPDGMGGGQWVQPPQPGAPTPAKPGLTFTPIPEGGPTLTPSGGFR